MASLSFPDASSDAEVKCRSKLVCSSHFVERFDACFKFLQIQKAKKLEIPQSFMKSFPYVQASNALRDRATAALTTSRRARARSSEGRVSLAFSSVGDTESIEIISD